MVTPGTPLSLRAYGRHRRELGLPGGNAVAVSRAITTQRLMASVVHVNDVAKIADVTLADQEWEQNTDRSKAPGSVKAQAAGVTDADVTAGTPVTPTTRPRGAAVSTLAAASAREKNARADLVELEFLEKAGRLVPAAEVEKAWTEMVSQIRTAILGVPSKYKLAVPDLSHAALAQLNDLLCQALESLDDQRARSNGAAA